MRLTGALDVTRGLGGSDHLCWGYDDQAAFDAVAVEFLRDGLAMGQRLSFVGSGSPEQLLARLEQLEGRDELLARGALVVADVGQGYIGTLRADPGQQVDRYALEVAHALDAGYTGLRVAADVTDIVLDAADRAAFVEYEHLIEHRMAAGMAFTALCAYDRTRLGPAAFDELACVHPVSHGASVTFRIHGSPSADIALSGEVDGLQAEALRQAFEAVLATVQAEWLSIDCSQLTFIDHRSLLEIDDAANRAGLTTELHAVPPMVRQLLTLLDCRRVVATP